MKKVSAILIAVTFVLMCSLFMDAHVSAAVNECKHGHTAYYVDTNREFNESYSHAYHVDNGAYSPTYFTCRVIKYYHLSGQRCADCGNVDYSNSTRVYTRLVHLDCGATTIYY